MSNFVKKNYPDSKSDLFAIFIEHCGQMIKKNGYQAMITQHAWMFLSSFEKLRVKLLENDIINMAHLGARAFEEIGGEVVQTTSFIIRENYIIKYKGKYCRLIEPNSQQGKEDMFLMCKNRYVTEQSNFIKIPGNPVVYTLSEKIFETFKASCVNKISDSRCGMNTGDNDKFIRNWFEIDDHKFYSSCQSVDDFLQSGYRYAIYNKGGAYRKWYGNLEYVIKFDQNSYNILLNQGNHLPSRQYYFMPCITWTDMSTKGVAFRYQPCGSVFDGCAATAFVMKKKYMKYLLGLLNSIYVTHIAPVLNPTLHFKLNDYAKIPLIIDESFIPVISNYVDKCIKYSKKDWDVFETSWDFQRHPLLQHAGFTPHMVAKEEANGYLTMNGIEDAYRHWEQACNDRFNQLKANEEELNRIFIDIYGLQEELTPEVEDKDVTVRKADLGRDIRSFISYAVGCMFGRYSLDMNGLAYAGGEWDDRKYTSFPADKYNIIPICSDEYFEDDIVNRFIEFVKVVYGAYTLDENLKFIADALGGKGQPKVVIRNYFLNEFYADHCKIYQKRPIYWLFDSGKKNGFKCLIYMHRYQPDTIARIRTDYVHGQQARYRTAIEDLEKQIANASTSERVKLSKKLASLQAQDAELRIYEEKIHHLADQMISIDLDDGVKVNYAKFQDVLAKIK